MDFDLSIETTHDPHAIAAAHDFMANELIARLEQTHPPMRMALFFPAEIAPVPEAGYAKKFGQQTLQDVMHAAESVIIAMQAREELEKWKYPN